MMIMVIDIEVDVSTAASVAEPTPQMDNSGAQLYTTACTLISFCLEAQQLIAFQSALRITDHFGMPDMRRQVGG